MEPDANSLGNASGSAVEPAFFTLTEQPIVVAVPENAGERQAEVAELPRSYGTEMLCLMPRDPHTLFAYWDINWEAAFRDGAPPERKVHLRILNSEGTEQTIVEVEPTAASCLVNVTDAARSYIGDLGWFASPGKWRSLATSESVTTPSMKMDESGPMELTTIPFHLSFQNMLDLLRVPKHESGSLVAMLGDLRERVQSNTPAPKFTPMQREVIRAIEEAVTASGSEADAEAAADEEVTPVWTQAKLERVLGIGPSNPSGGFGGNSSVA